MRNKPIRHHIAPKAYLDNFAVLREGQRSLRLHVLSRQSGDIEYDVKTKDIFYKHFYNHIGSNNQLYESAEEPLNEKIEVPGNAVISGLLDGKALTYAQTKHLSRYLIIGVCRSLWFHINLRATYEQRSKHHGFSASMVPRLAHYKQVETLRGLMGLPKSSPKLYKNDPVLEDPVLAREFESIKVSQVGDRKRSVEILTGAQLRSRELTIFSAPKGSEFLTGDNHVIPLPTGDVENYLEVPFSSSTEFLMPLSSDKILFVSKTTSERPNISLSRKILPSDSVETINNTVCIFSSAHIFSRNAALLKKFHDNNPFHDGKIVIVGGKEYSFFEHPQDLPRKFR